MDSYCLICLQFWELEEQFEIHAWCLLGWYVQLPLQLHGQPESLQITGSFQLFLCTTMFKTFNVMK